MTEKQIETGMPLTFTDRLREVFKQPLARIGTALYKKGIEPNWLTLTGVAGTLIGSFFVARGQLVLGGIIILLMGPIDALDGAVARARGETEDYGAFVDSVSDRYIELFIYSGLMWYFLSENDLLGGFLSFWAGAGSFLVSYTRARAQSLGYETKVGLLTRFERMVVIGPAIVFNVPLVGVIMVAILANITALQRIGHMRQQTKKREKE